MAVIDRVKWDGAPDVLAWKFPSEELSTLTQLIVNETQEAYLVKGGVYQGPFGAGRHTLSTENIPLLRTLIAAPFGGETPFTAEVWYVNKVTNLDLPWGTREPILLQDPKFQIMVPVRAFGQYGVRIGDAKRFLLKLVGTLPKFDAQSLGAYFRGVLTTRIKTHVANAIIRNGRSVLEISTELDSLSAMLRESLVPDLEEYGVALTQFNVMSINWPEDDPAVVSLRTALAKRTEMSLLGFNYQQERSFDVLQTAAGNEGTAGGVMGAGLGAGLGVGLGMPLGAAMSQMTPAMQFGGGAGPAAPQGGPPGGGPTPPAPAPMTPAAGAAALTCDKCGTGIPRGARFCPNCADPVNACPSCGDDNPGGATTCRSCGAAFPAACGACNAVIPPEARFCPACGVKRVRACSGCNAELAAGAKFCTECGAPAGAP